MKILILDDEVALRSVLSAELAALGYVTHPMADKAEGYDWIVDNRPDLIISDINSPGMNGWQLLRWLKANPDTKSLPVIFVTGCADAHNVVNSLTLGAADFVSKPYDLANLHQVIERVLRDTYTPPLDRERTTLQKTPTTKRLTFASWREVSLALDQTLRSSGIRASLLPAEQPWMADFVADREGRVELSRLVRSFDIGGLTTREILCFQRELRSRGLNRGTLYSLCHIRPESRELAALFGIQLFSPEQAQDLLYHGMLPVMDGGIHTPSRSQDPWGEQKSFPDYVEKIRSEVLAMEGKSFPVVTTHGMPEGKAAVLSVRLEVLQTAGLSFTTADNEVLGSISEEQFLESLASLWLHHRFCPEATRLSPLARSCLLFLLSSLPSLDSDGMTIYIRGAMALHRQRRPLIAILESNTVASKTLADGLRSQGYDVVIFESKFEFLRYANQTPQSLPCLIISDIFSPGLDGIEFLKVWKRDARFQHVPVFIVSGNIPKLTDKVQRLGASAWMPKPVDPNHLVSMVKESIPPPRTV